MPSEAARAPITGCQRRVKRCTRSLSLSYGERLRILDMLGLSSKIKGLTPRKVKFQLSKKKKKTFLFSVKFTLMAECLSQGRMSHSSVCGRCPPPPKVHDIITQVAQAQVDTWVINAALQWQVWRLCRFLRAPGEPPSRQRNSRGVSPSKEAMLTWTASDTVPFYWGELQVWKQFSFWDLRNCSAAQ